MPSRGQKSTPGKPNRRIDVGEKTFTYRIAKTDADELPAYRSYGDKSQLYIEHVY